MTTMKPIKMNPELTRISELRGCTYKEAKDLCNQVRSLGGGLAPSNKCIADALQQLEDRHQPYAIEDAARLARQLHGEELKLRPPKPKRRKPSHGVKFAKRPRHPLQLPPLVVHPDGTVTSSKVLKDEKYLDG